MIRKYTYLITILWLIGCNSSVVNNTKSEEIPEAFQNSNIINQNKYLIKNAEIIIYDNKNYDLLYGNILIENGIIKEISNNTIQTNDTHVIDGTGKFIIPALFDMHTHAAEENDLFLYVANGVTTIRHMWGSQKLLDTRARRNNNEFIGPRMFIASAGFEEPPAEWPGANLVIDTEKISEQVLQAKNLGYDFIKIYENLSLVNYLAFVDAANQHDIEMVGHLPSSISLDQVLLENTQKSIAHVDHYLESVGTISSNINLPSSYQIDHDKLVQYANKTSVSEVWNCPTLTITTRHSGQSQTLRNNPNLQYVSPRMRKWYGLNNWDAPNYTTHKLRLINSLYNANAKMILGTDTGLRYILPGFSVHEELKYFVDAGLPEVEALKIASKNCADFLNLNQGSVEVGKNAELLILDKNPLDNISNTTHISGVLTNGLWLNNVFIENKLQEIKSSY